LLLKISDSYLEASTDQLYQDDYRSKNVLDGEYKDAVDLPPTVFQEKSIETRIICMSERVGSYQSSSLMLNTRINDILLAFKIPNEPPLPDGVGLMQFILIFHEKKNLLMKIGDITPQGVLMITLVIDGVVFMQFMQIENNCSIVSVPALEFIDSVSVDEIKYSVACTDPFFENTLHPRNHLADIASFYKVQKANSEAYLISVSTDKVDTPTVRASTNADSLQPHAYNLTESSDDECLRVSKATKFKTRKARRIEVDQRNMIDSLITARSLRTREKPAQSYPIEIDIPKSSFKAAKKSGNKKQTVAPAVGTKSAYQMSSIDISNAAASMIKRQVVQVDKVVPPANDMTATLSQMLEDIRKASVEESRKHRESVEACMKEISNLKQDKNVSKLDEAFADISGSKNYSVRQKAVNSNELQQPQQQYQAQSMQFQHIYGNQSSSVQPNIPSGQQIQFQCGNEQCGNLFQPSMPCQSNYSYGMQHRPNFDHLNGAQPVGSHGFQPSLMPCNQQYNCQSGLSFHNPYMMQQAVVQHNFTHPFGMSYNPRPSEDASSVKKVIMLDLLDMIKKIN